MKRFLTLLLLSLSYVSHYSLAGTTLNWPSAGGIEEWGFSRPYGCSSDDQYLMQLANKMHQQSNWGDVSGLYTAKSGEYTYGSTGQLIKQGKGNPAAVSALQNEINEIQNDFNKLDKFAGSYRSRFDSSYASNTDVINAVKSFSIKPVNCINAASVSESNQTACGMQALAFTITANVERFIQISCHLGGNVPTYAQASMPNNKVSSINTSDNTSSASSSSAGKNILKGLAAAVGIYTGVQEAKSNSRNRNAQVSQTVPQIETRTQTSQNNYPSDNSSGQSSSNSSRNAGSSSAKETTEGVNQCVAVGPDEYGAEVFRNICNIKLTLYWCVDYECTSNNGRLLTNLKPNGKYNVMSGDKKFFYAACPAPFMPNERPNGTFDGKNYTCEK